MDKLVEFGLSIDNYFWGLTAFAVFILIVFKFGLRPVVQALDAREEKISKDVASAEAAAAEAKRVEVELKARLDAAAEESSKLLATARAQAEEAKEHLLTQARDEAAKLRERATRDIETAKASALVEIKGHLAELATVAAGRILKAELDAGRHASVVAAAIEQVEQRGKV